MLIETTRKPWARLAAAVAATAAVQSTLLPTAARADFPFAFVEVTCAPELSYLAVRRVVVMNVPHHFRDSRAESAEADAIDAAAAGHHVYTSGELQGHPETCAVRAPQASVDQGKLSRMVVLVGGRSIVSGERPRLKDEVDIRLGGHLIARLNLDPHASESGTESIEVTGDDAATIVRACLIVPGEPDKRQCRELSGPIDSSGASLR